MTWVKLDDLFPDHPKVRRAGPAAAWLYIAGICYCARHLTDGLIVDVALAGLGQYGEQRARKLAEALVAAGLWEREDGGYRVHDYLSFQPSRQVVERQRETKRRAGEAGGQASARARAEAGGQAGA